MEAAGGVIRSPAKLNPDNSKGGNFYAQAKNVLKFVLLGHGTYSYRACAVKSMLKAQAVLSLKNNGKTSMYTWQALQRWHALQQTLLWGGFLIFYILIP